MTTNDKNFQKTLIQTTMNACKISDGFLGNMFMATFHDAFNKYSNLSLKCPIKEGYYYMKNFQLDNLQLPINYIKFNLEERVYVVLKNEKKKKFLCKIELIGVYEKV
jgi:hypothetical protein